MPTPVFATSTVAIATAAGGPPQYIKVVVLPDGGVVVAHAFLDSNGTMLDPVKDATVQAATAAILAATQAFSNAS